MTAAPPIASPPKNADGIPECLRRKERQLRRRMMLLAVLSLPGIALDGVFLSAIVWLCGPYQHGIPWLSVFWWCLPAAVILFWLLDRQSGLDWSNNLTSGASVPDAPSRGEGGYSLGGGVARGVPMVTEMLVLAPRLLKRVIATFRAARQFTPPAKHRSEGVLRQMAAREKGCDIEKLLEPGEEITKLRPALVYLIFYDWISISRDTRHVWLNGDSRKILQQAMGGAPVSEQPSSAKTAKDAKSAKPAKTATSAKTATK